MDPIKKLKNKRGTTLIEVMMVIVLMAILLGIAIPDIIGYSKMIKLTAMNDNARAVAVAVQSKLYAMKNSGTSNGSEYDLLGDGAVEVEVTVDGENKKVKYVCSWDLANGDTEEGEKENAKMSLAKQMLLSSAITDLELLENGYIVVVYDPATGDILYVYYSDEKFDVEKLFPTADETYLKNNYIGQYIGEPSPVPSYKAVLPNFSCEWVFDDEMYLQLTMVETPPDELLDKPLGLEVFARIPKVGGDPTKNEWDEVLIYAEGFFATDYVTTHAKTIKADNDGNPNTGEELTLQKILDNKRHLKFALDSLVMKKAGYGNEKAQSYLRHQTEPKITSAAENLLYPREAVANWFNGTQNPYLTVFNREYLNVDSGPLHDLLFNPSAPVTNYVPVDRSMSLHVKLHVLSDKKKPGKGYEGYNADNNDGSNDACELYNFDDTTYSPVNITSENMSPYFYALSNSAASVYVSSMRDFGNLAYVFNDTSNNINSAHLVHDISGQEFYDKLVATRYAAIEKIYAVYGEETMTVGEKTIKVIDNFMNNAWAHYANRDTIGIDTMRIANRTETFTIDGKKRDDSGDNYSISNVEGGGRNTSNGGFFTYAENVVFKNIDIINPRGWRNHNKKDFLSDLNDIKLQLDSIVSGSLVGMAVNCTFDNVHAYIDSSQSLIVENDDGGLGGDKGKENKSPQGMAERRIEGTVVGGLVGLAIGDSTKSSPPKNGSTTEKTGNTSFTNCSASALLTTGYYWAPSQCVYAGGLVGIAFGNVSISSSYAASSLNGYYSGGLVGAATNGDWKYTGNDSKEISSGTSDGTLKIENSFAAGHICRLTRIGAGLIARIGYKSEKPSVSSCYSAVHWDALSPVAYGTFPGDDSTLNGAKDLTTNNYYISQTDLSLPITANVEAHFKVTSGDVIAKYNKSGIPCTAKQLNDQFKSTAAWGTESGTSRWRYNENSTSVESEKYPFPMPTNNSKFWGDWINTDYYKEDGTINNNQNPKINFDKYICLNYSYNLSWGDFPRHVNTGVIVSKETWVRLYVENNKAMLNGNTIDSSTNYSYWATQAIVTKTTEIKTSGLSIKITEIVSTYGQGIDGATTVVLDKAKQNYVMYGPKFYDPTYDPITGYKFKPTGDGINLGDSQLNWDYYGFYCTPKFDIKGEDTTKYYIQFDKEKKYNLMENNAHIDETNHFVYVNGEAFTTALNYQTFTLSTSPEKNNLNLVWKDGYFQVQNKGQGA